MIIANVYGSVISSNALLTVVPAPPWPNTPGTVVSWGRQVIPYLAPGTRFTNIVAGRSHSLAIKSDGTALAWGENWAGQSTVPAGLNGVVDISVGEVHSLALNSDGTVVAWGQINNGSNWVTETVPNGLGGVVAIAAGGDHSLALIPAIMAEASGNNFFLVWPISAIGFTLQSSTNITDPNSWTTMTNIPVVVGSQNRVTDAISGPPKFFRLRR